ncbi:acetyl-CoA carboxylase, carboxyltransferase subunit beta [Caminibacter pacificus]|uniref:Acetyl-coenzyme A carboxylase carboxyl transferase subunit beta n=1 Tax=Caminibacter pacificus TaxID=1424653 RepID=A0AAJ4RBD0_9BACT|nr:acetyl-CoA carboxylase, carboxyltransferase subunit beta [Caminibacter pacificus]QCI27441.1 acetyl-CoA carboxylase, carboxyltransferase subunit beta [Caminibacter pacificus]ROR38878.1 acetyl-CoA carboxylase carboxyltransferase subunit alpha [Caminibacter pacificus]
MGFGDFLKKFKKPQPSKQEQTTWVKCPACGAISFYKEVQKQHNTCPKCGYHFRMSAQERIEMLADEGTFVEYDKNLEPNDPLNFVDKKSYKKRIEENYKKTGRKSSVISGECKINEIPTQLVVFDFAFMGGSLGSVEGEKIARAVMRAIEKRQGLVIVSTSGGARMQESTFSLMQMAKTSAALASLAENKLPYISVLTDPTFGGVSASFAFLGDYIIAEPGAMIGFAGPRVIKQTIGEDLPEGFQRAEFLLEHGLIDMVVKRDELKKTISDLLRFSLKSAS